MAYMTKFLWWNDESWLKRGRNDDLCGFNVNEKPDLYEKQKKTVLIERKEKLKSGKPNSN
ncbi:unnamed protein product [Clavelina lepadiformis]|uniref:Uncharacterized protein n=1 Tax=Clavelina lepadiformis TaxID=159417 RepID=A0ABP0G0B5_CLALP